VQLTHRREASSQRRIVSGRLRSFAFAAVAGVTLLGAVVGGLFVNQPWGV
jgi:hypothetical protein